MICLADKKSRGRLNHNNPSIKPTNAFQTNKSLDYEIIIRRTKVKMLGPTRHFIIIIIFCCWPHTPFDEGMTAFYTSHHYQPKHKLTLLSFLSGIIESLVSLHFLACPTSRWSFSQFCFYLKAPTFVWFNFGEYLNPQ